MNEVSDPPTNGGGSVRRTITASAFLVVLALSIVLSHAQSSDVSISRLAALTLSGRMTDKIRAGDEYWGVGVVLNSGQVPQTVTWSMTFDGAQISYGGWTLPPGKH